MIANDCVLHTPHQCRVLSLAGGPIDCLLAHLALICFDMFMLCAHTWHVLVMSGGCKMMARQ